MCFTTSKNPLQQALLCRCFPGSRELVWKQSHQLSISAAARLIMHKINERVL